MHTAACFTFPCASLLFARQDAVSVNWTMVSVAYENDRIRALRVIHIEKKMWGLPRTT